MGIDRIHVIGAGICALLSWLLVTAALPSLRWTPHAFFAGFLLAILCIGYLFLGTSRTTPRRIVPRPLPSFISTSNWDVRKADVNLRSQYVRRRLFENQLQLSSRIDGILELITNTFITSWFTNISSKHIFQNEVDRALRDAITSIHSRVQSLDLIQIGVSRVVPIITEHMQEFYTAERLVRGKNLTRDVTESEELDFAIASKYNDGKLHQAASLAFADTKLMQQAHVRKSIEKILPLVMSEDMLSSPAVLALVREIVSCAVLAPILLMMADPDMWSQIIENYGKSILQDRKNVRKLRAALDEHASGSPGGSKRNDIPRLRPNDHERQFERFIRNLRKTPNLAVARRYRSEINSRIRKGSQNPVQDPLYLRRLEASRKILDQRIMALSSLDATIRRTSFQSQLSAPDVNGHGAQMPLKQILHHASGLSYFMEFMDRQKKMRLVQFWIIVDGFRDPLEGDADEADISLHEKMTFESSDRMNIKQLRDTYLHLPELQVPSSSKEAVDAYVNAGKAADLVAYVKARRAILRAQTAVYDEMKEEHLEPFKRSDLFYKWTASETKQPQSPVVEQNDRGFDPPRSPKLERPMSQRPVSVNISAMRKQPELRRAVMSATDLNAKPKQILSEEFGRRSIDDNTSRPLFDDDVEDERMTRSVPSLAVAGESDNESIDQNNYSAQVVDAMQRELSEIIDEPEKDWPDNHSQEPRDSPSLADELFRSPGSTESAVRPSIASLGLVAGTSSRGVFTDDLFGHEEERYLEDEKEDPELRPIEDEIQEAAPGDLGLTEAISALSHDIDRLVEQEKIVESLTKKAELTNNAAELRILRKSGQSLQREIRRKEMQKQQYVVQESDNSLYGRAAISIKSIMVGKEEDGHEFAIYVIEVRRQAGDHMPAAAWTITRRYSEFHELHKRLRSRFESVRNLEFPRRQTLFTLQKDFLQRRRIVLERYLRSLLLIPAICRSRELRAFLSQSAIVSADAKLDSGDLVTRIYNSVSDGMEEFLGNLPMLDQLTVAGQNLISAASAQISGATPAATSAALSAGPRDPSEAAEAEAEINAFDDASAAARMPFVKPIGDLFLEAFELQKGGSWLRGRAVVVVLHQLLGGAVERKIRDAARAALDEPALVRYVDTFRDIMWPGGVMRQAGPVRTVAQKAASRAEAQRVLEGLVPDMAGSVVGRQNARQAGRKVGALLGNQRLNTHLIMRLFDEIVGVVFPEIGR